MAKARTQFLCNSCGSVHPKWMGKCPDCGTWDGLQEYKTPTADERQTARSAHTGDVMTAAEPIAIDAIEQADTPRMSSGISEFDRVLGGGIVPGSAVLVGGEPGIGKSTLLLQVAGSLAGKAGSGRQAAGSGGGASAVGGGQSAVGKKSIGNRQSEI